MVNVYFFYVDDSTDKKIVFVFAGQTAVGLLPKLQSGHALQTLVPLKEFINA
jgi:hypothetical protein